MKYGVSIYSSPWKKSWQWIYHSYWLYLWHCVYIDYQSHVSSKVYQSVKKGKNSIRPIIISFVDIKFFCMHVSKMLTDIFQPKRFIAGLQKVAEQTYNSIFTVQQMRQIAKVGYSIWKIYFKLICIS